MKIILKFVRNLILIFIIYIIILFILVGKGYKEDEHIRFVQLKDGRHDVPTWAKAFPDFLKWGWGEKRVLSRES